MNVRRTIRSNKRKSGVFRVTAQQSTWNVRNDSTNVSDLLAPELREEIVGKVTLFSDVVDTRVGAAATAHCETCYCRKPIVAPRLLRTQRSPPRVHRAVRRYSVNAPIDGDDTSSGVSRKSSQRIADVNKSKSRSSCKFVNDGFDYESFEVSLDGDKTATRDDAIDNPSLDSGELAAEKQESRSEAIAEDGLKKASDLRPNSRSFETTSHYQGSHKCVHKFRINERLMPEPVNCDTFGVSRCEICNKPMEKFRCDASSPKNKSVRKSCAQSVQEYNLAPPRLNVGTGKERIEIVVSERARRECLGNIGKEVNAKLRKNVPCNSLALRFQKGVV